MRQDRLTPAERSLRGGLLRSKVAKPDIEPLHYRSTESGVLEDRYLGAGVIGQRVPWEIGGRASALWLRRPLSDPTRGTHDRALPMLGSSILRRAELTERAPRR